MTTAAAPGHRFDGARWAEELEGEIDFVHRALRRHGVDAADADDLVQDVFVVAWRRRDHFESDRPLRAWLAGIAYRVARRHLRRRGREVTVADLEMEDRSPAPEEALVHRRARRLVLQAFADLSPDQRALIEMHDLEGLRMKEIAHLVGVPLFTAYTRLRRARLRLASRVEFLQTAPAALPSEQPLSVETLLEIERTPPRVPERVQVRVRARIRGLAVAPAVPDVWQWVKAPWRLAAAGMGAAGLAALVLALSPSAPASAAASAAARGSAAGAAPVVSPVSAPAKRGRRVPTFLAAVRAPIEPPTFTGFEGSFAPASLRTALATHLGFGDALGGFGGDPGADQPCRFHGLDPRQNRSPAPVDHGMALRGGWIECPQPEQAVLATTEVSAAAWVKLHRAPPRHVSIVSRQLSVGNEDYFFFGLNRGKLKLRSDRWQTRAVVPKPLPLQQWHHVAFSRASDGTVRLYLDGDLAATANRDRREDMTPITVSTPLAIGAGINGPGTTLIRERLDAVIDEVVVYDRVLSGEEVADLAEGATPGP